MQLEVDGDVGTGQRSRVVAPDEGRGDGEAQLVEETVRDEGPEPGGPALGEQPRPAASVQGGDELRRVDALVAADDDVLLTEARPGVVETRGRGRGREQDRAVVDPAEPEAARDRGC